MIFYRLKHLALFLFLSTLSTAVLADDSLLVNPKVTRMHLKGFIKDMQSLSFVDNAKSLITGNLIHNRINFRWDISAQFHIRLEARNRLFYGEQVKTTYQFGKYVDIDNGLMDISYNIVDDTSVVLNTMLDRVLLNWSGKKWDITLGRQRINWGINLVWNPNDIFNAFNYFDFDYEERPGTDAMRVQCNVGKVSTLELAYKLTDNRKEQVGAFMHKTNFKKYDWQNFAGVYYQDMVVGTGWAGNIQNTGFKGEASYFHPYENAADTTGALSATVSLDRSFKKEYFVMVSYLYNSSAKGLMYGVNELTGAVLSPKKLMPFRHSFFAQVSKGFSPLVNGSLSCVFSDDHCTLVLLPSFSVSVSDNWDVAMIGQSFFSETGGTYHTLGNGIYFRLRWSY
ncbi:MAG: hypothetical protein EPN85_12395 [Bacteroidetes bacterium]|nr:MAG: hypothetical protein EPN85_12395 [Bacteroidota bacterium]